MRRIREVKSNLEWFAARNCFRFRYREPGSRRLLYLYCTAPKFRAAGIDLESPDVVRKKTRKAEGLAKRLRAKFLESLAYLQPETTLARRSISQAIASYFELYDHSPRYRSNLNRIFTEFAEVAHDKPCDELTDRDLKAFERSLQARDLRSTTVRSNIRVVFMLVSFCCKKGWISRDPRMTYRLPKDELQTPNPLSMKEISDFFSICKREVPGVPQGFGHLEWMGIGMLCLGLRPVELEHARWENVDWKERFLYIDRSHGAKMPQACQNQPIPIIAWEHFIKRRKPEGLIWTSYFGGPCTASAQARARRSIQDHLPGFQWKRFRKSYATILGQAGNDVVLISRLLRQAAGGRNVTIAQRHYIGKSHRILREVVDEAFMILEDIPPFQ